MRKWVVINSVMLMVVVVGVVVVVMGVVMVIVKFHITKRLS